MGNYFSDKLLAVGIISRAFYDNPQVKDFFKRIQGIVPELESIMLLINKARQRGQRIRQMVQSSPSLLKERLNLIGNRVDDLLNRLNTLEQSLYTLDNPQWIEIKLRQVEREIATLKQQMETDSHEMLADKRKLLQIKEEQRGTLLEQNRLHTRWELKIDGIAASLDNIQGRVRMIIAEGKAGESGIRRITDDLNDHIEVLQDMKRVRDDLARDIDDSDIDYLELD